MGLSPRLIGPFSFGPMLAHFCGPNRPSPGHKVSQFPCKPNCRIDQLPSCMARAWAQRPSANVPALSHEAPCTSFPHACKKSPMHTKQADEPWYLEPFASPSFLVSLSFYNQPDLPSAPMSTSPATEPAWPPRPDFPRTCTYAYTRMLSSCCLVRFQACSKRHLPTCMDVPCRLTKLPSVCGE